MSVSGEKKFVFIRRFRSISVLVIIFVTGLAYKPGITSHSSLTESGKKTVHPLFDFHSGLWINLHHFIYHQALIESSKGNTGIPRISDTILLNNFSSDERQHWLTAIAYYQKNFIDKDLLMDRGMESIKNALEDQENESLLKGPGFPAELEVILNNVSASYKKNFWEKQNQRNRSWIGKATPAILQYGDILMEELGKKYQVPWPGNAIRVDVTNYASWTGAYTSLYPDRITISSVDLRNQPPAALEIIFHEASHVLIDSIRTKLSEICKANNKLLPKRDLWHALLFYTTGEIVKDQLKQYTPYAYQNGLWDRAWPMYIDYLVKDWHPYIKGETTLDTALAQLVRDVGVQK